MRLTSLNHIPTMDAFKENGINTHVPPVTVDNRYFIKINHANQGM